MTIAQETASKQFARLQAELAEQLAHVTARADATAKEGAQLRVTLLEERPSEPGETEAAHRPQLDRLAARIAPAAP